MSSRNFRELIENKWAEGKFACVGLDPDPLKFPTHLRRSQHAIGDILIATETFCEEIVEATFDKVCAYKPQSAFFEGLGLGGLELLGKIIKKAQCMAPDVPIILDAKRADIGSTNAGYIKAAFDWLQADAITVHPYLGQEALQNFLDRADKGIFVLCRTSNPGAREFQDIFCHGDIDALRIYERVAVNVSTKWNKHGNCGLVVGATYPTELAEIRDLVSDMPFLIPGIGAQGGDLEKTVQAGKDSRGRGMIINSSRGILYASSAEDYAEAARRETIKLHDEINRLLGLAPVTA